MKLIFAFLFCLLLPCHVFGEDNDDLQEQIDALKARLEALESEKSESEDLAEEEYDDASTGSGDLKVDDFENTTVGMGTEMGGGTEMFSSEGLPDMNELKRLQKVIMENQEKQRRMIQELEEDGH